MNRLRSGSLTVAIAAAALAAGCEPAPMEVQEAGIPQEMLADYWPPAEPPVSHIIRRDYRIREGDQLEVIYHVRHQRAEQYRIKIQDRLEIRFPFQQSLNQVEQVQSDGYLYLDLIGRVYVFDRTIEEVEKEIHQRYARFIKDPVITISFKESNVKIAELKQAITTSPRGQSRLVPVTPDGTISIPFVVTIRAAGKSVEELHRDLNEAYRTIGLEELEVTINLQEVAPMRVYVLGEVRIPGPLLNRTGAITASNEMTLLQALAQAGSYIPGRAELSKVMLIRRRHLPKPQGAIINVFQLLENRKKAGGGAVAADMSKYKFDIWLEDGDIIYVPTTEIAKRADYIDFVWTRGIRAVGGFTSTYTVGDAVDWLGPN